MKDRTLHVIANLDLGGAQAVLYHLWPSLCADGRYDFDVCVLNSVGQFGEQLALEGATIHSLGQTQKYSPKAVPALRKLIKEGGYKIVHAHLFPELYVVALAAAGLKDVHLVYTEHSANNRRRKLGIAGKVLDRVAYGCYEQITAVNSSARRNLIRWQPSLACRTIVINNCVRANHSRALNSELLQELNLPSGSNHKMILFAGRLSREKGVDVLVNALSRLGRNDYLCLIAGDGDQRQELDHMVRSLALDERVRFLGRRSDVTKLLRQVDLMVLPSRYEGLPLIVLEAMAAQCPIIATSVDGTAEVLCNEETALLVSPDDAASLAVAIDRLLDSPRLGREFSRRAAIAVSDYSAQVNATKLLALYDKLLGYGSFANAHTSLETV